MPVIRQIQKVELCLRCDDAGNGAYGAPRGSRVHKGIDFTCVPGDAVLSPINGVVTKLGYTYGDDLSWRYVQVTNGDMMNHRLFYVDPLVKVGQAVSIETVIGQAQDISRRYPESITRPRMTPHIHYEVMDSKGEHYDPATL